MRPGLVAMAAVWAHLSSTTTKTRNARWNAAFTRQADRIPSICRLKAAFRWYCQDAPAAAPTKASSWIPICAGYKLVVSV